MRRLNVKKECCACRTKLVYVERDIRAKLRLRSLHDVYTSCSTTNIVGQVILSRPCQMTGVFRSSPLFLAPKNRAQKNSFEENVRRTTRRTRPSSRRCRQANTDAAELTQTSNCNASGEKNIIFLGRVSIAHGRCERKRRERNS